MNTPDLNTRADKAPTSNTESGGSGRLRPTGRNFTITVWRNLSPANDAVFAGAGA